MYINELKKKIILFAITFLINIYESEKNRVPTVLKEDYEQSLKVQYSVLNKISNNITQISIGEIAEINDACLTLQEEIENDEEILNEIDWCKKYKFKQELENIIRMTKQTLNNYL